MPASDTIFSQAQHNQHTNRCVSNNIDVKMVSWVRTQWEPSNQGFQSIDFRDTIVLEIPWTCGSLCRPSEQTICLVHTQDNSVFLEAFYH